MKRLSRKQKIEMLIGKVVLLIIESLIGCGLVLGFFYLLGIIEMWAEKHLIVFFTISGILLIKMFSKEFCE